MAPRKRPQPAATPARGDLGDQFLYTIPCTQGIQAGKLIWVGMVPVSLLKKLFRFDDPKELKPNPLERMQRLVNFNRVKKIAQYIQANPLTYVFSAATVSIDADVEFVEAPGMEDVGFLKVPMDATFHVADGQHRIAALKQSYLKNPELGDEAFPVVFHIYTGPARQKQMFLDLNKEAVKPVKSNILLYDHRNTASELARRLVADSSFLKLHMDFDRTSISSKTSDKVFTFNGLHALVTRLLESPLLDGVEVGDAFPIVAKYWRKLELTMPDWKALMNRRRDPLYLREDTIACHAITLEALGMLGAELLPLEDWTQRLDGIERVQWERTNPDWASLFMVNGRIVKNAATTKGLKEYIQQRLYASPPEEPRSDAPVPVTSQPQLI